MRRALRAPFSSPRISAGRTRGLRQWFAAAQACDLKIVLRDPLPAGAKAGSRQRLSKMLPNAEHGHKECGAKRDSGAGARRLPIQRRWVRRSMTTGHNRFSLPRRVLLLLAALALAGCETTGTGAGPAAQAAVAGPPQPPMTHS